MASGKGDLILSGISGKQGKELLVKQYKGGRIVITRFPLSFDLTPIWRIVLRLFFFVKFDLRKPRPENA